MAKDNFKATDATKDKGYAGDVGTTAAGGVGTGLSQEAAGFGGLQDVGQAQKSFAQMLQEQASGTGGPTMADQQIKDATARNNANAAGFAASAKGLNPALAARQALMAQSGNNQQAAGQAAQTRIQEMQSAQAQEGGALAGAANTAGAATKAGEGLLGTAGSLANSSNQNIINNQESQDKINAGVASANTSAVNGAISGVMNAAGAAFGMAEGGRVPAMGVTTKRQPGYPADEWDDELGEGPNGPPPYDYQYATGGFAGGRPPAARQPQRSFAAQVAHHLQREYFADGGTAQPPAPTNAQVAAEGDVKKKAEMEAARKAAEDQAALEAAAAQPKDGGVKRAYGGDAYAEGGYDEGLSDDEPTDEYMAWGGAAGAQRDYTRRMALGGMVGPGAGRAGSAPNDAMRPEMQVAGAKVKYRMPRPPPQHSDVAAPAVHDSAGIHERPDLVVAAPTVTAAPTARGFRNQLRSTAAYTPRGTVQDDRMQPLMQQGGTYRQPVNFSYGGAVENHGKTSKAIMSMAPAVVRDESAFRPNIDAMGISEGGSPRQMQHLSYGGAVENHGKTSRPIQSMAPAVVRNESAFRPNIDAMGISEGGSPRQMQHLAKGGTPATAEQMTNAADPSNVGEMPNVDSNGNASPTGQGMNNGQSTAKPGFFDALGSRIAQHFANSPIGSLIMGTTKPATSSGTPLAPGEHPAPGQPVGAVPAETPDVKPAAPVGDASMTQATGSPVEGRALAESDADAKKAKGGRIDYRAAGGPVPGQAEAPGDSLQNDTVPAMLSPGEVVLPRTIAHKPHEAKKFVQHLQKHGGDGAKTLKDIKKRKAG